MLLAFGNVNASGKWSIKKKTLQKVECNSYELLNIIDSVLTTDKSCPYYSNSLLLSIRILQYSSSNESFQLIFDTGSISQRRIFLSNKPIGFLKIAKHICFIYYNIPKSLFSLTKESCTFYYKYYTPPKKLKKGEVPLIFPDDDSFSSWIYDFDGSKFKLLETHQPCISKVAEMNIEKRYHSF
jgi:hypothetical protein